MGMSNRSPVEGKHEIGTIEKHLPVAIELLTCDNCIDKKAD